MTLSILDVTGRIITTLVDDRCLPGKYVVIWNGETRSGAAVGGGVGAAAGSGVYFYRLTAGDYTATRKRLITR